MLTKQPLSEFLAAKGFWVLYPRYRGAWESGGKFLAKSPHGDILDVLDELPKELEDIAFGQRFRWSQVRSLSSGAASGERRRSCFRSMHGFGGRSRTARLWTGQFWTRPRKQRLPKQATPTTSGKRSGMPIGCPMPAGISSAAAASTALGTIETKLMATSC